MNSEEESQKSDGKNEGEGFGSTYPSGGGSGAPVQAAADPSTAVASSVSSYDSSKSGDKPDVHKQIDQLSPTTQESVSILIQSLSRGEARIVNVASGKPVVEYNSSVKMSWDASQANLITDPKSDSEKKKKVDACLELINYFKSKKFPSGVRLDKTEISLSPTKEYRAGYEFKKTKRILGSGNSAGDIIIVEDTKTGKEHARKTMVISVFCENEIRCWLDMMDTGYVPRLYYFGIAGNKVSMHMEILKDARTIQGIIDDRVKMFCDTEANRSLIKPFSLFVLNSLLAAITCFHDKKWLHKDLHAGNVMLQKASNATIQIKVLDFGMARRFDRNFQGFQADIAQVLRLFSGLYTGNVSDIRRNWRAGLSDMSMEDRGELFCLMDAAMKVLTPSDVEGYRRLVQEKLDNAMADAKTEKMKRIVDILFQEEFADIQSSSLKPKVAMGRDTSAAGGAPAPEAGGAPPPPLPAPPPPPPSVSAPAAGGDDGRSALFANICRGAAGLKKVADDMKTHKNPTLKTSSTVPGVRVRPTPFKTAAPPETAPKPAPALPAPALPAPAVKSPVFNQDTKWMIDRSRDSNASPEVQPMPSTSSTLSRLPPRTTTDVQPHLGNNQHDPLLDSDNCVVVNAYKDNTN